MNIPARDLASDHTTLRLSEEREAGDLTQQVAALAF
jgi:hypothetical protein